jgi:hypothetical protein
MNAKPPQRGFFVSAPTQQDYERLRFAGSLIRKLCVN